MLWFVEPGKKVMNSPSLGFHSLSFLGSVSRKEQNRLVYVEARNSVLQIWAPIKGRRSQWCNRLLLLTGHRDSEVAGFVLGKGKGGEEGVSDGEGCRVHWSALRASGRRDG